MTGEVLIIRFKNNKVYLSESKSLPIDQTNIDRPVHFKEGAYWKVRVLNYNSSTGILYVSVINSGIADGPMSFNQTMLPTQIHGIKKISFKDIPTNVLLQTTFTPSRTYKPTQVQLDLPTAPNPAPLATSIPYAEWLKTVPIHQLTAGEIEREIKFTWPKAIKDITFQLGKVCFHHTIAELKQDLTFTIYNEALRAEFDAVKNYFANVLGTKKITVSATIKIKGKQVIAAEAHSPEISKITPELIEKVRYEFMSSAIKKRFGDEHEQKPMTMEEFFQALSDREVTATTFYQKEEEVIDDLLKITQTKHYKHLGYLSSKHDKDTMQLRFLIKPFSYIFLIPGEKQYHFVWETLDTKEATYIWHIDKTLHSPKEAFKQVEKIIITIQQQGREPYLKEGDINFQKIKHEYTDLVGGFIKWKDELETSLV